MSSNKEIYLAKACKIVNTQSNLKKLEVYDEKIIVITDSKDNYKEIITGIDFKRYPKFFSHVNEENIYIFLDKKIDFTKEGYDLIKRYYEEKTEKSILHMIDWFYMSEVDRYNDYIKRFEENNIDYETTSIDLIRKKMKQNKKEF